MKATGKEQWRNNEQILRELRPLMSIQHRLGIIAADVDQIFTRHARSTGRFSSTVSNGGSYSLTRGDIDGYQIELKVKAADSGTVGILKYKRTTEGGIDFRYSEFAKGTNLEREGEEPIEKPLTPRALGRFDRAVEKCKADQRKREMASLLL